MFPTNSTPTGIPSFTGLTSTPASKVSKEDHDKEKARWLGKLDEIEVRLVESETLNNEMVLLKAELNKKIVEMESRQKPLIDHNRKLTERNRTLQTEMRKMEQKYSHSQDDFLTLRDAHERILKENTQLKEKRTSPEKLEELDRYRSQVLEYSKCITALRGSGLEKDRRYEALVQKFKQLKKMVKGEDDKQSVVGSDCSGESSISFDTINEDFEESLNKDIEVINQALYKENAELQKALNDLKSSGLPSESESLLRDQLNYAQSTIAQQQILIETNQEMISQTAQLKATVASQQTKIKQLEQTIEDLQATISSQREKSELLEFQVLESEARRKSEERERPSDEKYDENAPPVEVVKKELNLDEIISLKSELRSLRNAPNLKLLPRQIIGRTEGYIANLEEKFTETTQADEIMKVLKDKLNNVEKNATELEKKSQKSEKQLKELQGKITEKDKQLEDIQKIKKESEERLIEMEKKDKESTEKLNTMEKKLGEIDKVKKQLKEKNDELEKASKQFEAKVAEYENKMKEQQSQLSEPTPNPETEKALQQEVEALKNKVSELVAAKEKVRFFLIKKNLIYANFKLDEEMRVISKEMSKLKYNLQNKESELERETKNAEQLNAKLQEIVHSNQEESIKKEQKMSKLKKDSESIKKKLADFETKNKSMQAEYDNLKAEYERFKEDQRPSIRTELERRYEETRYRLMCALEKIDRYEKLFEAARKTEGGGNFSQILEQEVVELKEFNAHLERQFQTQSEIIDALKMKIINQKKFNDLVFKLCNLENSSEVEEILSDYAKNRDNEGAKLADCIVFLMKIVRKNHSELMSPLEISTNAHKIRPYNSIDSSNEWMSNSSEGMQSPDEHDGRWEGKAAINNNHQYARGAAS
ncbi:hypothetical protein WR25_22983 [Diploscapter pachys]|uniref:Uncharacterized protein n=1 Tax=Diploscapter pachys TaxID=2018661 RepID=A0A2A2JM83_9BILA|nr:hypothetical protein WR25_22983 [Diploscapter pachys]